MVFSYKAFFTKIKRRSVFTNIIFIIHTYYEQILQMQSSSYLYKIGDSAYIEIFYIIWYIKAGLNSNHY